MTPGAVTQVLFVNPGNLIIYYDGRASQLPNLYLAIFFLFRLTTLQYVQY